MHLRTIRSLGRRSSQPIRLSSVLPQDQEEKSSKIASGAKIPRPTAAIRSSSVERDVLQSSSKSRIPRSTSLERVSGDEACRKSELRTRSTESLFTPQSVMKTPAPSSGRVTSVSVKKTVKKDTRPLSDRAFQNMELAKVHEYLTSQNIITIEQVRELRCPMTTKLFVLIMNLLLQKLFPTLSLTLSNYCEQIPTIMKKLKYPGSVTRSWLLTANTPLSWPHVLGLMSWLVELLRSATSSIEYVIDDDDMLDSDRVHKLNAYIKERYIEWSENETEFSTTTDQQFFDDLVSGIRKPIIEQLHELEKKVQMQQQKIVKQTQNPEELAAVENFEKIKGEVKKGMSTINRLEEEFRKIQLFREKVKSENCVLLKERENMKKIITSYKNTETPATEDFEKLQSEFISCENIVKVQDAHLADYNGHCYADDLANARLQGKLEKVRLQHSALLREYTFKYKGALDTSQLTFSLNYECGDHSNVEFQNYVKEIKQTEGIILKEYTEKERKCELKINKTEETTNKYKEESCRNTDLLPQGEDRNQKKNIIANLKNEFKKRNEMHSKIREEITVLEESAHIQELNLTRVKSEVKSWYETQKENENKYNRILKRLQEEFHKLVQKCLHLVKSSKK